MVRAGSQVHILSSFCPRPGNWTPPCRCVYNKLTTSQLVTDSRLLLGSQVTSQEKHQKLSLPNWLASLNPISDVRDAWESAASRSQLSDGVQSQPLDSWWVVTLTNKSPAYSCLPIFTYTLSQHKALNSSHVYPAWSLDTFSDTGPLKTWVPLMVNMSLIPCRTCLHVKYLQWKFSEMALNLWHFLH